MPYQSIARFFKSSRPLAGAGRSPARKPAGPRLRVECLEDRAVPASLLGLTANTFAVLGGAAVTNTGPTTIDGNLGVSPGTSVTGFPPGVVTGGIIHTADAVALQAQADVTSAFGVLAGLASDADLTGLDLGDLTLTPGVYTFASTAQLTGTLTLDAQGDPDAQFVFQIGSALTTASSSSILFINGADEEELYWRVGSSATLGSGTAFAGNILAQMDITLGAGASIACGRALARVGAVTMITNNITIMCDDSLGSISGRKVDDLDGDGVLEFGEPGLAGVTLYLDADGDGAPGPGERTVTTNADGDYRFTNLAAGAYRVRQATSLGLMQTTPDPADVVLGAGEDVTGVDFGDFQLGSIGGTKFNDVNGNGARDAGDLGVAGVTVYLDADGDGFFDAGETSDVTDGDGTYTFTNLGPGPHRVREVRPAGTVQTTADLALVTLVSGGASVGGLIGNFRLASITGSAFNDANGNGVRNAGERGLAGVTFFIDTDGDGIIDAGESRAVTNAAGNYTFTNLGPGAVRVRSVTPVGRVRMTSNPPDVVTAGGGTTAQRPVGFLLVGAVGNPSKLRLLGGMSAAAALPGQTRFVANLYETRLGRAPDLAGLRRFVRLLQAGYSQAWVAANFRA